MLVDQPKLYHRTLFLAPISFSKNWTISSNSQNKTACQLSHGTEAGAWCASNLLAIFWCQQGDRIHASMRGLLLLRGWAPTFWGSSPTATSPHCPCGPLKWQAAELIMEGAHLQV